MGELSQADEAERSVPLVQALDHEALLTLARKVHAAASDGDLAHLKAVAREFEEALAGHLQEEATSMSRIAPAEERILHRGQKRLWSVTLGLLANADHGCPHPAQYCSDRAEELVALMTLQAHDERRALLGRVT